MGAGKAMEAGPRRRSRGGAAVGHQGAYTVPALEWLQHG
jgi:hypothetical protein